MIYITIIHEEMNNKFCEEFMAYLYMYVEANRNCNLKVYTLNNHFSV
jgi:hypothetical protein